jgi:S-adenosylmethionine/arginine decarboxylase-like enzyme
MKSLNLHKEPPGVLEVAENDSKMSVMSSYDEIVNYYENNQCWGLLTSIDAKNCDGELIRSATAIKEFVIQLCDLIKMKRFQDTVVVNFGEDEKVAGYSMVQLIETSLISGHFANLTNTSYIDIFSCKLYDPYQAAEFTKHFFGASDVAINTCFRK